MTSCSKAADRSALPPFLGLPSPFLGLPPPSSPFLGRKALRLDFFMHSEYAARNNKLRRLFLLHSLQPVKHIIVGQPRPNFCCNPRGHIKEINSPQHHLGVFLQRLFFYFRYVESAVPRVVLNHRK